MAQVKFFRRTSATQVAASSISDADAVYLVNNSNKSYMFFGGQCIGGSWKIDEPILTTGTATAYTITLPYEHTFAAGDTINVKFHVACGSAPTLNGTSIVRRLSNALMPQTLSSSNIPANSNLLLRYTLIGSVYYWVIVGQDKPAAADLYGQLPSSILEVSTTDIGAGASLTSGKLYVVYSN